MENLDINYWEKRYQENETGWDIGDVSTPLKTYFDQLKDKEMKILIPGAGNAYEAEYLFRNGFRNVYVVDWAKNAINNLKQRFPEFPSNQLIQQDLFRYEEQFDLIVEQTFFCALPPAMRTDYAKKMHDLLKPGGSLVGVLFKIELYKDHPPFGGDAEEYRQYFEPYFEFKVFEECYNSIKPRQGNELFINLKKRTHIKKRKYV